MGKYGKWLSCDNVPKRFLFFWGFGESPCGFEYDKTKAVSYTWNMNNGLYKVYGIVNDQDIKKIDILLSDGKVLSTTDFYNNLFLLTWESPNSNHSCLLRKLIGYDRKGKVIFETFSY
jgi:hypothetical protein